ncbi:MAG: hypothetical protein P4L51_01790 [Puia sp.]|nr:hypothetical protein [Puia sp.]
MKTLFAYLDSIYPLSVECRKYLSNQIHRRHLRRHEILLHTGDCCQDLYFVRRGMLWSFRWERERQTCQWFMRENDIATSVHSFFLREPSQFCIQAVYTTDLFEINRECLEEASRRFPVLMELYLRILRRYYCLEVEKNNILLKPSIRQQYHYIRDKHPWMVRDLSSRKLAAWLGTTEQHLSRIKKLPG